MFITSDIEIHAISMFTYDKENFDYADEQSSKAEVRWDDDIEHRNWGIKTIAAVVHNVKINKVLIDHEGEPHNIEIDCDKMGFLINTNIKWSNSLYPTSIEVNEEKKEVIVHFN